MHPRYRDSYRPGWQVRVLIPTRLAGSWLPEHHPTYKRPAQSRTQPQPRTRTRICAHTLAMASPYPPRVPIWCFGSGSGIRTGSTGSTAPSAAAAATTTTTICTCARDREWFTGKKMGQVGVYAAARYAHAHAYAAHTHTQHTCTCACTCTLFYTDAHSTATCSAMHACSRYNIHTRKHSWPQQVSASHTYTHTQTM